MATRNLTIPGPVTAPNTAVRNLDIMSGGNPSILAQSGQAAGQVAQAADPYTLFNQQLLEMMQRHQQLGTARFQRQEYNAEETQNNRVLQKAPQDLVGAAPGLQASARSGSAAAVQPTINQARNAQQTFGEQIQSFGQVINTVRSFAAERQQAVENQKADAREQLLLALELGGPDGLDAIAKADPNIFKVAGLDQDTLIAAAKKAHAPAPEKPVTVSPGSSLVNPSTGEVVYTAPEKETSEFTAAQKGKKDTLNAVLASLKTYRDLYNQMVGGTGVNVTGEDAGSLAGAYNALIFQIAEASGTGALQAADREVVENMIPNPTSFGGSIKSLFRGGKTGSVNALNEAERIFQNKLTAIEANGSGDSEDGDGSLQVTAPNGKTYQFSTQEQADAFRAQVGQ